MLTVYTAVFGQTYKLQPPEVRPANVRYLCFTDDARNAADGVETILVKPRDPEPERAAKWHKWHPPDGDTLWIDSAYQLTADPTPWFNGLGSDIGLCAHGSRTCTYLESKVVVKYRHWEQYKIRVQMKRYRKAKFPGYFGLWEGGIIFRNGARPIINEWNEAVWAELQTGSVRDQVAIPYAIWKTGITVDTMPSRLPQMVRQHRQAW